MKILEPIPLEEIKAAKKRLAGLAIKSPLIRLNVEEAPGDIYLKLENLQPGGSFKIRGAVNAMGLADKDQLAKGVYTASAGNMALSVAWYARRIGVHRTAVVPEHAPEAKCEAIRRFGGKIMKVPRDEWWQIIVDHQYDKLDAYLVHPTSDRGVIAGNGTIGLEILEELPDVDAVIVPYGGGGLSSGIASAIKALKPEARVYASEVETAAPLAPSLTKGAPKEVPYAPSFVDGIGSQWVLKEMWPLVSRLLEDSIVVSLKEVAEAVRLLLTRHKVLAEGAGGTSVAAALTGRAGSGRKVCIVSGGNIDVDKLAKILKGQIPPAA
jgi:threonine dehydratase